MFTSFIAFGIGAAIGAILALVGITLGHFFPAGGKPE